MLIHRRLLDEAQKNYTEQQQKKEMFLSTEQTQQIMALATDFPAIWYSPNIENRDRKRIVRLLIEDVTLKQDTKISVDIRFKGGTTKILTLSLAKSAPDMFATSAVVIEKIDFMLNTYTDKQIVHQLNQQGLKPGRGKKFSSSIIKNIRRVYNLKGLTERLREKGYVTAEELSLLLNLSKSTIRRWHRQKKINGCIYNDKNEYLYEPLNETQINALKQAKWSHVSKLLKCV